MSKTCEPAKPADLPESAAAIDHLTNLRRLIVARWGVLLAMAVFCLLTPALLDIPLIQAPLLPLVRPGLVPWV